MKKSFLKILPILVFLIFLVSCATQPVIFDETLSSDEVAIIYFKSTVNITEYNGIAVNWKPSLFGNLFISIPGGDTQFILNGESGTYNMGVTSYRNIPFNYNFENGKEYTVNINQNLINVFNGKSQLKKNHIVTFNMYRGQTIIYLDGKRVRD